MRVEFSDNIKQDIRDLISSIPFDFRHLNAGKYIDSFEELNLRITENIGFQCEIAFNNTILLSQASIEIIWSITYAHFIYYKLYCKGIKPDGQTIELNNENWIIPKEMLTASTHALINNESFDFLDSYPRNFCDVNEIGKIFKYALIFFLSHELFHVKYYETYSDSLHEENNCDIDALKLILNSSGENDYLIKSKGICYGLMILNVYGIHTNYFDGITHPFTYDRLIKNIELFFGKENDKIWGLVLAMFALHMTEKGISQPTDEFETFHDCIIEYKRIFENSNANK